MARTPSPAAGRHPTGDGAVNGLLFMPDQRGYPADYLRGRIRARKESLITDWERLLAAADPLQGVRLPERSEEGIWSALLLEYAWIWRQMEPKLRLAFAPFFVLVELHTLVLVLRLRQTGNTDRAMQLLESSQLGPAVKARLMAEGEPAAVVVGLVSVLGATYRGFYRLEETFRQEGLSGFERELSSLWLEQQAGERLHPVIDTFFRLAIDQRNMVSVAKHLRWGLAQQPAIIRGGELLPSLLEEAAKAGDAAALAAMVRRMTGEEVDSSALERVEPLLLAALTRQVRRMGRRDDEIGPLLDYLWRRFMEARNLGVLFHGARLDRDTVRAELVT